MLTLLRPAGRFIRAYLRVAFALLAGTLAALPVIVSGPDHAVLPFGSTNGTPATFTVVATGEPPLSYRWIRIEQRVNFAGQVTSTTTREYPDETNASITVTDWPLTTGTRVRYYVIVRDATGTRTSPQAAVTIAGPPPPPAAPVIDADLAVGYQRQEGEALTLAIFARGTPAPIYVWRHNGIVVPDATNSSVVFNAVTLEDQGRWQVTVTNSLGSATSRTAEVLVVPLIEFTSLQFGVVTVDLSRGPTTNTFCALPDVAALRGQTLSLHTTGGQPPFNSTGDWEIAFQADGTYSVPASSMTARSGTWTLNPGGPGVMEVILTSFYEDGATATLSLLETCYFELTKPGVSANQHGDWRLGGTSPVVTIIPPPREAVFGVTATTAGGGPLTYQWYLGDVAIPSATNNTYAITNATSAEAGSYTVRVSRPDGRSRLSPPGLLVVTGAPEEPLAFTTGPGTVTLSWPDGTVLQTSPSLTNPVWTTLETAPGTALPTGNDTAFFRWMRPPSR